MTVVDRSGYGSRLRRPTTTAGWRSWLVTVDHKRIGVLYGQLFTVHGLTMIFLVVMPLATALFNLLLPLQIGARDVAFPSVDQEPPPLRTILGSQALQVTLAVLRERIAGFEEQTELAASTVFPPED